MKEKLLINHKRFKNKKSVILAKKYFEFFNNYAKKNYSLVDNNCTLNCLMSELSSRVRSLS